MIFYTVLHSVCLYLTNSIGGLLLLHTFSSICYLSNFNDVPSNLWEVYLTVVLICIATVISNVEHIFMCFWLSVCIIWRHVYLDLLSFRLGCFFFRFKAVWDIFITWRLICCWLLQLQIFSPILWIVLCFVYGFLFCVKTFEFT